MKYNQISYLMKILMFYIYNLHSKKNNNNHNLKDLNKILLKDQN